MNVEDRLARATRRYRASLALLKTYPNLAPDRATINRERNEVITLRGPTQPQWRSPSAPNEVLGLFGSYRDAATRQGISILDLLRSRDRLGGFSPTREPRRIRLTKTLIRRSERNATASLS